MLMWFMTRIQLLLMINLAINYKYNGLLRKKNDELIIIIVQNKDYEYRF